MGQVFSKKKIVVEPELPELPERYSFNGFFRTGSVVFPAEIMEIVLSFCDMKSIPTVRLVCQDWNKIVKNPSFWKMIMTRHNREESYKMIREHIPHDHPDGWQVYMSEYKLKFLSRNLVKNPCGTDGTEDWEILSGTTSENGWKIRSKQYRDNNENKRIEDLKQPPYTNSDFTSGSYSCSKEQIVDLWKHGFTSPVMRACVPFSITWSDWLSNGPERGIYECKVYFLERELCHISPFSPYEYYHRKIVEPATPWHQISHEFRIDSSNAFEVIYDLRYFHIYHGAMTESLLMGRDGPSVTNTALEIKLLRD